VAFEITGDKLGLGGCAEGDENSLEAEVGEFRDLGQLRSKSSTKRSSLLTGPDADSMDPPALNLESCSGGEAPPGCGSLDSILY
jgi:hypothetical protein